MSPAPASRNHLPAADGRDDDFALGTLSSVCPSCWPGRLSRDDRGPAKSDVYRWDSLGFAVLGNVCMKAFGPNHVTANDI